MDSDVWRLTRGPHRSFFPSGLSFLQEQLARRAQELDKRERELNQRVRCCSPDTTRDLSARAARAAARRACAVSALARGERE